MTEIDNRVLGDMQTQEQEFVFRLRKFLADPNKDLHQKQRAFTLDSKQKSEDQHVPDSEERKLIKEIAENIKRVERENKISRSLNYNILNTGLTVLIYGLNPYGLIPAIPLLLYDYRGTINEMAENARHNQNRS